MRNIKKHALLILLIMFEISAFSQKLLSENKLPVLPSNENMLSILEGNNLREKVWRIDHTTKPDVYEVSLVNSEPKKITFFSDVDSITFLVQVGKQYDFIVKKGKEKAYTRIIGKKFIPAAIFDKTYQKKYNGKVSVEIPEVYELINIAIALTKTGIEKKRLVYKNSVYYKEMRAWFDKYRNHELVTTLNEFLPNRYSHLKMDGYAFVYNKEGKLAKSDVYDRISWRKSNTLEPYIKLMQSFSDESDFRYFYKRNLNTYKNRIDFYRNNLNINELISWLDGNFPNSKGYNSNKIIFSPLVYSSQSANWFESNGFKELQAHVNFPYLTELQKKVSSTSQNILRGMIVFTELNHGYINPEADKHKDSIMNAIRDRDIWADKIKASNYPGNYSLFNEYMNWGLINLLAIDKAPKDEQGIIIERIESIMADGRGFINFRSFSKFLMSLYKNRKPNQTLADLYPEIIEWFKKH